MGRALVIIALLIAALWVVVFFTRETTTPEDEMPTENDVVTPSTWQTYASAEFPFQSAYPEGATVGIEGERVKVTYLGRNNEPATEITDGFTFYADSETKASTTTLEAFATMVFDRESNGVEVLDALSQTTIGNKTAYTFVVKSRLGPPITHLVLEGTDERVFLTTYMVSGTATPQYLTIINTILESLRVTENSEASGTSSVEIALLQTEFTGEPERGCDRVVMVERSVPTTTAPLTAALRELFSLEEGQVPDYYNFIANTNETLSFDRAEVRNGTAHIYLEGRLTGLAGVCDNPRAQIQIEETALQFPTVQNVQIYLNGSAATLTPSEQ